MNCRHPLTRNLKHNTLFPARLAEASSAEALKLSFSFLANVYGCQIKVNSNKTIAKPQYNNRQPGKIYGCTPDSSSTQYEVHVLAVYEVINTRPPSAGVSNVNIISRGQSSRPIILVLGSYEPVNWFLNLPAGISIRKVILVSTKSKTITDSTLNGSELHVALLFIV